MRTIDKFHEECGVVAIYGHPEAAKLAYLGLYALQHRGQESAGICTNDGTRLHCHKSMGHVAEIFTSEVLAKLPGSLAIGHTRYSTAGDTAILNAQPFAVTCNKGRIAVAHNGNIVNAMNWARAAPFFRLPATPRLSCICSPTLPSARWRALSGTPCCNWRARIPWCAQPRTASW